MREQFIPSNFQPPREANIGEYKVYPLTEEYLLVDLAAVNSSVNLIRETRGGTWPRRQITAEEDFADLVEHREEFEGRRSFAYTIVTKDKSRCAGSIYVYPPNHPFDDSDKSGMPEDADAVINFWASLAAYNTGFYPILYAFVDQWIKNNWPFQKPYISNKAIPEDK